MSHSATSRREDRMLLVAGYLVLIIMGWSGLNRMYQDGEPWEVAALLLLAFGILLTRTPSAGAPAWQSHLYLAIQSSLVTVLTVLEAGDAVFPILYFIIVPQALLLLPQRQGVFWLAAISLAAAGASVVKWGWSGGLTITPLYVGAFIFFGILANALMRADEARRESQRLLAELQEAHRQLGAYADRVEELAVVEERNRLAREMHDTLGHQLTVAAVQLEGAQRLIPGDPTRAVEMAGVVREQVSEALGELRRTVAALRAPLEEDLQLRSSLRRLTTHFEEATGIVVHLMLPEERPYLPDVYRVALYRAAQEALTNVQRHARAREVWFQLVQQDGMVTLMVGDNGVGSAAETQTKDGFGLRGLRERAAQLGGEMHLDPRPGGGSQLRFSLPIPQEEAFG